MAKIVYVIGREGGPDGQHFIRCFKCEHTSYDPEDIRNHYCGHCNVFLDDIPPADK